MNVWSKLITALRGGANELGETILDGQALRVLDQEVREAANELVEVKQDLASIMAKVKVSEIQQLDLRNKIAEHEQYAMEALNKNKKALALEIAEKIAGLEAEFNAEKSIAMDLQHQQDSMRAAVKLAEQNIRRLRQQVDTVKATENVQRAQAALVQRYQNNKNSHLHTAMDSIKQIKLKQQQRAAEFEAANELERENSADPLMEKLKDAGIIAGGGDAKKILSRLKEQADKK